MTEFVSPYLKAAAERAGYRSPLEMPIQVPAINPCPSCGHAPIMENADSGGLVIWCDHEECEGRDMQANGRDLKEVAAKWNSIGSPKEADDEMPDPQGDAYDAARDREEEGRWDDIEAAGAGGIK